MISNTNLYGLLFESVRGCNSRFLFVYSNIAVKDSTGTVAYSSIITIQAGGDSTWVVSPHVDTLFAEE
jgi:hypothetical protein